MIASQERGSIPKWWQQDAKREWSVSLADPEMTIVGGSCVKVNRWAVENPKVRSRHVAQESANSKKDALFAGTLPLPGINMHCPPRAASATHRYRPVIGGGKQQTTNVFGHRKCHSWVQGRGGQSCEVRISRRFSKSQDLYFATRA